MKRVVVHAMTLEDATTRRIVVVPGFDDDCSLEIQKEYADGTRRVLIRLHLERGQRMVLARGLVGKL